MDTRRLVLALLLSWTLLFTWFGISPVFTGGMLHQGQPQQGQPHLGQPELGQPQQNQSQSASPATSSPSRATPASSPASPGREVDSPTSANDTTVHFGWLHWLIRPLHLALLWLAANWTGGNLGWAIVVATVLIRLCLWPLTHRMMRHMNLVCSLNPQVQDIRKRFENRLQDKKGRPNLDAHREMNDQVMAIYRQAGTTPVSGCMPMLLQSPVLIAFFYLLRDAPELQGAPWALWIQDLSAADPYFLLPIIMGATQLLQQLAQPAPANPLQRRLFLLLPVVFTLFFLNAASGLVLYWLTSNLITLIQQLIYRVSSKDQRHGLTYPR